MSNKLEDYAKSLQVADVINRMKPLLHELDLEHLRHAANVFADQSNFEDTAAVLNPNYDPQKSKLLAVQSKALSHLASFVEGLKECDKLKEEIAHRSAARADIAKLFI